MKSVKSSNALLLSIDQGTTSSRVILFDLQGRLIKSFQQEFPQHYPQPGWVEHQPEEIWQSVLATLKPALTYAHENGSEIIGIGITNQRETVIVWDRATGEPIYNAIVWQDRRTADICSALEQEGSLAIVKKRTGLLLDPYFSATKVAWILDHVDGARLKAEKGELAFGTVDSFLIWRLTGGRSHVSDATNASRTSLFNIHEQKWDPELLSIFRVPEQILPEVKDCAANFGVTSLESIDQEIPILGVAGDQQAAAIGQACFSVGESKSTYGTGCFMLVNTGAQAVFSENRLLTTVAYRLRGLTHYALEGSIFIAGAVIQWLRDELRVIEHAKDTEALAASIKNNNGVYLVPAFTGMGAPHWDPNARGAIYGLTRASGRAELVRAALESVCYQTADLIDAMRRDGIEVSYLKVDGGMVVNNWLSQCLADTLNLTIERPEFLESTALGVAYLAALQAGVINQLEDIDEVRRVEKQFTPSISVEERAKRLLGWQNAVKKTLSSV